MRWLIKRIFRSRSRSRSNQNLSRLTKTISRNLVSIGCWARLASTGRFSVQAELLETAHRWMRRIFLSIAMGMLLAVLGLKFLVTALAAARLRPETAAAISQLARTRSMRFWFQVLDKRLAPPLESLDWRGSSPIHNFRL